MKKYKCTDCNYEWFSDDDIDMEECPDNEDHIIKEVKTLTSQDYAELWGQDLESENRHSLTDMPDIVLDVLIKYVKDRKIVRKIMKDFYNMGIGM
jgi:hypothetical protein